MFDLTGISFLEEEAVLYSLPIEISFMIGLILIFIGIVFIWNAYNIQKTSFKKFKDW